MGWWPSAGACRPVHNRERRGRPLTGRQTDMEKAVQKKKTRFMRFLDKVEIIGNKLPQPVSLFGILAIVVVLISGIGGLLNWSATGELYDSATGQMTMQTVNVVSLMNSTGVRYMLTTAVNNFVTYAPLGVVLTLFFGIGVADGSGFLAVIIRKLVQATPKWMICPTIVFIGVCSNIVSSSAIVILVPLAALIFMAYDRHPFAGVAAAMAGISGGFSANLLITDIDTVSSGVTTVAANIIDPNYVVTPVSNWYFMVASTAFLAVVGTIVTERIVEPMLGKFDPSTAGEALGDMNFKDVTAKESKALTVSALVLLFMIASVIAMCIPQNSWLRNAETGSLIVDSTLMNGMIPLLTLMFFVPSVIYGFMVGTFKSEKDVVAQINKTTASCVSLITLAFTAAQFVKYFNYSKLGTIIAILGADFLAKINMPKLLLLAMFVVFGSFINIFMQSATAKWIIFAPLFVPMFMKLGIAPELTQLAYRLGDSCTNCITPLNSFLPFIIVILCKYKKDSGIGTYLSLLLPYSMVFLVTWILFFVLWVGLGIPIGPASQLFI